MLSSILSLCILLSLFTPAPFDRISGVQVADAQQIENSIERFYADGEYEKALAAGEVLLALQEPTGKVNPALLVKLANLYRVTGQVDKAETAFKKAISGFENLGNPRGLGLGAALERYGCFLQRNKSKTLAADVQRRALSIIAPVPDDFKPRPVSGMVRPGQKIDTPQPKYPKDARQRHVGGAVTVVVLIDETGKPLSACTELGDESLAVASEDAAFRARFTPTTLDNVPVRVNGKVTYNFVAK